jgi:hypothetical protein
MIESLPSRRGRPELRTQLGLALAPRDRTLTALGLLASLLTFYPAPLDHYHRVLTPFIAVYFLTWTRLIWRETRLRRSRGVLVLIGVVYVVLVLQIGHVVAANSSDPGVTPLFERIAALFPFAAASGWMLVRSGRIATFLRPFLLTAVVTTLLAVYEYRTNTSIFRINHAYYVRNGHTRAVVGSDHPLVLASLLLAMIPIAMFVLRRHRRLVGAWLFAGVLATGSNGAAAIGAALLVLCLIPPLASALTSSAKPLLLLLSATLGYLAIGAFYLWGAEVHGSTTTAVSNEYRGALYHILPQILRSHPLGYGLSGLPVNRWIIPIAGSGIRDLRASVDSELVYGASQFGLLAILVFLAICVLAAAAAPRHAYLALSSVVISIDGLYLALHCWDSLGSYWLFGAGACAALLADPRNHNRRALPIPTSSQLAYDQSKASDRAIAPNR